MVNSFKGKNEVSIENRGADVILISCVKSKQSHACSAGAMYTSSLFKKMMTYAHKFKPKNIFILSAKYGLLTCETVIEPYELTLSNMTADARKIWAEGVLEDLRKQVDLENDHFVFLAGRRYRKGLVEHMSHCTIPMESLGIGKQLQWLSRNIK